MDPFAIIGGIAAAGAAGAGLRLGGRLIPIGLEAHRDWKRLRNGAAFRLREASSELRAAQRQLARPEGRRRESSIVGIYEDCLRHADGAYTRLYEIALEAAMLAEDSTVERRCDDFARLLCMELPKGTMVQVRYRVDRDPGRAIAEHLRDRRYGDVYLPAARMHDFNPMPLLRARLRRSGAELGGVEGIAAGSGATRRIDRERAQAH